MNRIVVTDSTADIPEDLLGKHNIKVLPVNVILDGKNYRDGVDISRAAFYDSFARYTEMASAPVRYEDYGLELLQLAAHHDEVLIIHCSKHLSTTHATALRVTQDFIDSENCRVEVIDSGQCSMGLGLIVIAAAEAMERGLKFDQVLHVVDKTMKKIKSYMAIPTLKYLKKNKKINGMKALLGATMGVKPVLEMKDGRMVIKSKLFGEQKNMILSMMGTIKKEVAGRPITLSIIYAGNSSLVDKLREAFADTFECRNIYIARFSPAVSLNTGPESYAVFYKVEE